MKRVALHFTAVCVCVHGLSNFHATANSANQSGHQRNRLIIDLGNNNNKTNPGSKRKKQRNYNVGDKEVTESGQHKKNHNVGNIEVTESWQHKKKNVGNIEVTESGQHKKTHCGQVQHRGH